VELMTLPLVIGR